MNPSDLLKECLGKYVKYDTYIGRQLANYSDIRGEIVDVGVMSDYYTRKQEEFNKKYIADPDPNAVIGEEDILPLTGVFTNIVMAYGRCFDSARQKDGEQSRRLIKLNRDFLKNADPAILDKHDRLIDLRNQMVAHAGVNGIEKHDFEVGIDPEGYFHVREAEDNRRALSTPDVEIDQMEALLQVILKEIDNKISILLKKAEKELDLMEQKGVEFLEKLSKGQPITNEDIK